MNHGGRYGEWDQDGTFQKHRGQKRQKIGATKITETAALHVSWQPGLIIPRQDKIRDVRAREGVRERKRENKLCFPSRLL